MVFLTKSKSKYHLNVKEYFIYDPVKKTLLKLFEFFWELSKGSIRASLPLPLVNGWLLIFWALQKQFIFTIKLSQHVFTIRQEILFQVAVFPPCLCCGWSCNFSSLSAGELSNHTDCSLLRLPHYVGMWNTCVENKGEKRNQFTARMAPPLGNNLCET